MPGEKPMGIEIYGRVALTGQPVHFDSYSTALQRHYNVFAYCPAPRQFAVLFTDVTAQEAGRGGPARKPGVPGPGGQCGEGRHIRLERPHWRSSLHEADGDDLRQCARRHVDEHCHAPVSRVGATASHPDDRPWLEERLRRSLTERTSYPIEYRVIWPDGSLHWVASRPDRFRRRRPAERGYWARSWK